MKTCWCFLMLLILPLFAQVIEDIPVPVEPKRHILDDARLFTYEPERLDELDQKLASFSERTVTR